MNFVASDLVMILPELFILTMACGLLLADVYRAPETPSPAYGLAQAALLGALVLKLAVNAGGGGDEPLILFHGHYVKDGLGDVLAVCIFIAAAVVFLYSRDYLRDRDLFKGEFYALGLFGVLGMLIMVSAHTFLALYLGLELMSLSLYALVAFNRDSPIASEAAIKYFVLGALASGMLLYGISMLYGATGSLDLGIVAAEAALQGTDNLILVFGLVFLVVGLAFKLGAVPFHMWLPDVYQGAPTAVTLYIASVSKLAAFAMAMRLLVSGLAPLQADWQLMLIVLAVLSIGLGNLVAVVQTNIKRLLAYSAISNAGFLLLGVLAGTPQGYAAALFYAITYVLMTLGAFGILLVVSRAGFEAENIDDLRGLNDRDPWLALMMALFMVSLTGLPPLVGFYSKLLVLQAVINIGLVWLAIYGVLFSVIGAFYYLRVVKAMYFDPVEQATPVAVSLDTQVVISTNGLLVLVLGIYPTALMALCAAVF